MHSVAFVPIKFNSTRLKNKNLLPFGEKGHEKPLLTFIFDILLMTKELDEIYCYCSDDKVKQYLPNGIKYYKRPEFLDGHDITSNELLFNFAKSVDADCYLLTHATNPMILSDTIDRTVSAVKSEKYDSAMTVRRIQDLLWINGKPNFDPANAPLTQNISPVFQETYGALCLKRDLIINEHRRAGYNPAFIEVSEIECVDINTKEDYEFAKALFNALMCENGGVTPSEKIQIICLFVIKEAVWS